MQTNFVPLKETEKLIVEKAVSERKRVETRFPLFFGMLVTFGFVSTLYGFEKIIDRIPLFTSNPWILLVTGITILVATGTAYIKLH